MKIILDVLQITVCVLLVMVILLQSKGTGLGSAFGQSSETFRTKRGMERILHTGTIALSVLFFLISFVSFLIS